jgi:hypothetical protein
VGAAQTAATTLVDAPQAYQQTSRSSVSFQEYLQSHPFNISSINFKLLEPPSTYSRPISSELYFSPAITGTVLLSFNGLSRTLDQLGISYQHHRQGIKDGKGVRVDPTKFYSKVFRRRKKR